MKKLTKAQLENLETVKLESPHIFHEYQDLQRALKRLEQAEENVARCQERWDNLGKGDVTSDPV